MKTLSILLLSLISLTGFGQMKKADEAFAHHHYVNAIELYNAAIRRDLDNEQAITNLAVCYWKTEQYSLAEYWFTRAALMNDDPQVKLWYSQLLISNEKYEEAAQWLEKYAAAETDPALAKNATRMASYCLALKRGEASRLDCDVLPVKVNSPDLDFAPVLWNNMLLFTSNRVEATQRSDEDDPWTSSRFTDVFMAPRISENTFGAVVPFEVGLLTAYHEGPLCFSGDGMEMYLTTSDYSNNKRKFDNQRNTRLKIVKCTKDAMGAWVKTSDLPFVSSEYNTAHAAVSPDGNWLVFASDMPGGFGGMDLYRCMRSANGNWGSPQNLGKHINTKGHEVFPYIHSDGNLYFSSDLHLGFGGLDLYKCELGTDTWGVPDNLGAPINSSKDDFGIALDEDTQSGFFSSNRNMAGKDDLLYFKFSANISVKGAVVDCETRKPIAGAEVKLYGTDYYSDVCFTNDQGQFKMTIPPTGDYVIEARRDGYMTGGACSNSELVETKGLKAGDHVTIQLALSPQSNLQYNSSYVCGRVSNARYGNPIPGCVLELTNKCTGEKTTATTDNTGTYFLAVDERCDYEVKVLKDKFHPFLSTISPEMGASECFQVNVALTFVDSEAPPLLSEDVVIREGMVLELFHIYFDRDKSEIREEDIPDLETLYKLLIKHPGMKGEIMAHTDSRATAEYNLTLSQKRAEAAMAWLINKGIESERLTARGYGEMMLKNRCADGVECDEEEHQRNRRVEFRVTDVGVDQISREKVVEDTSGTK